MNNHIRIHWWNIWASHPVYFAKLILHLLYDLLWTWLESVRYEVQYMQREPLQTLCDSQYIRVARHKQEKPPDLWSQVPCAERGSTCLTCLRSPHSTRRNPRGFATRSASLTGSWPVSTPFTTFMHRVAYCIIVIQNIQNIKHRLSEVKKLPWKRFCTDKRSNQARCSLQTTSKSCYALDQPALPWRFWCGRRQCYRFHRLTKLSNVVFCGQKFGMYHCSHSKLWTQGPSAPLPGQRDPAQQSPSWVTHTVTRSS